MGAAGIDQAPGINAPAPGQLVAARVTLPNPHVCTALLGTVQLWTLIPRGTKAKNGIIAHFPCYN